MIKRTYILPLLIGLIATSAVAQTYTDLHHFVCTTDGCPPGWGLPEMLAQGRDGNLYGTMGYGGLSNNGTVFKITPSGTITVLHYFDGTTGIWPLGGLTLGLDGNFYGTTVRGGAYNDGTVFRISPSGTLTTLHSFADFEGCPYAPPILGSDGNFYGVTGANGTGCGSTAYKVSPKGVFKSLGFIPSGAVSPLMEGSDGKFYFPIGSGGILQMLKTGMIRTVYTFSGTQNPIPNGALVQDAYGYLYGMTTHGGAYNLGTIFKLTTKGVLTQVHDFDSGSPWGSPYGDGLLLANDGNLYGGTFFGGVSNTGVLFQLTPANSYMVLYEANGPQGGYFSGTPIQHTNGIIYGLANTGVFYSLDLGLSSFVTLMNTSGTAGKVIQILGQGFTGTTGVQFGTGSASFTVVSDTYITAVVPVTGTTAPVTVVTPTGTLISNKTFKVIPKITGFNPTSGTVGDSVVITGTGLTQATSVMFGGVKATTFTVNSAAQVTATVPFGAVTGKIALTTPGGTAGKGTFTVH